MRSMGEQNEGCCFTQLKWEYLSQIIQNLTGPRSTVDSRSLEPSREIEKGSIYREFGLSRVNYIEDDLKGKENWFELPRVRVVKNLK